MIEPGKIIFDGYILALTSAERLDALRQMSGGWNWMRDKWFIMLGIFGIIVLTISLFFIRHSNNKRQRKVSLSIFDSNANRLGLDDEQRKLAWQIAQNSGVSNAGQIFISSEAFDVGCAKIMNEHFKSGVSLEQRKIHNRKIKTLRDIFGFTKIALKTHVRTNRNITSRHVSVGRELTMVNVDDTFIRVQAGILESNDYELWLKPFDDVEVKAGQSWKMFYHLGASVWEFKCLLIGIDDNKLVFNHSEDVKFINRRRFRRVAVKKHAWIARFEYSRNIDGMPEKQLPEFYPARAVEMSGPGFKMITLINYNIGERVLVVVELKTGRLIQDIAEVRHVRKVEQGYMLALEMVGVDEETTDELVRETNRLANESEMQHREIMQMSASSV